MQNPLHKFLDAEARQEWKEHWRVVVAVAMGMGTSLVHMFAFGLLFAPLEQEFGWTRAQIASGLMIVSIVLVPLSPVSGMMIDRFGPRRMALLAKLFYCLALASFALVQEPLWTWWLLWLFIAFVQLVQSPTLWVATVTSLFVKSRGFALAVALSASGITHIFVPALTYIWMEDFGWRTTFILWGISVAVVALPCMYFWFYGAIDKDRLAAPPSVAAPAPVEDDITVRETLRSAALYKLAVAGFLVAFIAVAITLNIVPILNSLGISTAVAAGIAGLFGISQMIGRLGCGHLLDRYDARHVGAIIVLVPIITCVMLLAFGATPVAAGIAVFIIGLAVGGEVDVLGYLGSRFFGRRNFATLFGIIMSLTALGTGLGPLAASFVYDTTTSYNLVLWAAIPLSLICGLLLLTLGAYPKVRSSTSDA